MFALLPAIVFRKRIAATLVIFAFLNTVTLWSQVLGSFSAPDFWVTGQAGQAYHLYDLLNDGKIVVIKRFSTQSEPCWNYKEKQALQKLFLVHGPGGDDQVRVLMIETDPTTNSDCLSNTSTCNADTTFGNWFANNPIPVVNCDTFPSAYTSQQYSFLHVICPDKNAFIVNPVSDIVLWEVGKKCPVAKSGYNPGLYYPSINNQENELCANKTIVPKVSLVNTGTTVLNNMTIELRKNDSVIEEYQWTGSLLTYQKAVIEFNEVEINPQNRLNIRILTNAADVDLANNEHVVNFKAGAEVPSAMIRVWVRTDDFGNEIYWAIKNEQGDIIAEAGNTNIGYNGEGNLLQADHPSAGTFADNQTVKKNVILPGYGCYTFKIVDGYGDGICCNQGEGWYKILPENFFSPNDTLISGRDYRASDVRHLCYGTVDTDGPAMEEVLSLRLSPNPVGTFLTVSATLPANTKVRSAHITDVLGRSTRWEEGSDLASEHNGIIDVSQMPLGHYSLTVITDAGVLTRSFVVNR
jgi:hypothetical protein